MDTSISYSASVFIIIYQIIIVIHEIIIVNNLGDSHLSHSQL